MRLRDVARVAGLFAAAVGMTAAQAQQFSDANFDINRERVQFGTIKTCAGSETYLVPTVYLYVAARVSQSAGGGLGVAKSKARVYIDGLTRSELQGLAAKVHADIVGQLRAAGYKVLTFDDVRGDVADKARMETNPRYGMPTHKTRFMPGTDFFVAAPSDDQTLAYGLIGGPPGNFAKAAQRTGATLLLPEIYLTLPQLGASASKSEGLTWRSSTAKISFDPAMHLASATVWGSTAKGGWCSIVIPEHGMRLPATVAGQFQELSVTSDKWGDWSTKSGDYSFVVNNSAFDTGVLAVGRSLGRLMVDSMSGRK